MESSEEEEKTNGTRIVCAHSSLDEYYRKLDQNYYLLCSSSPTES